MSRLKNETTYINDKTVELQVVDLIETMVHNGSDLRIEFCQCSWFQKNENSQPIGKRTPVARLLLTKDSARDLAKRILELLDRSARHTTDQRPSDDRVVN